MEGVKCLCGVFIIALGMDVTVTDCTVPESQEAATCCSCGPAETVEGQVESETTEMSKNMKNYVNGPLLGFGKSRLRKPGLQLLPKDGAIIQSVGRRNLAERTSTQHEKGCCVGTKEEVHGVCVF